ncbi:MAG: hypothetical protein KC964_30960 [Candidatus Omnitrophica bacterium]|nr:hypothetical protein [Candidatus Omnitrophota bacterium]
MRRGIASSILSTLLDASLAHSATLEVPTDFTTIQAAIDSATHGDEIVVATGTYHETIHFQGKNIHLASTNPRDWTVVEATIIDASQMGSVVTFSGSETQECVLAGLTIRSGSATEGGGVNGNGSKAMLEWNSITENEAHYVFRDPSDFKGMGGGVFDVDGVIRNCRIHRNRAEVSGSGLIYCDGLVQNNLVTQNDLSVVLRFCDGLILNNTIVRNAAGIEDCRGLIANCIVESVVESTLPIHSCIIDVFGCWGCFRQGGIDTEKVDVGNIRGDPGFVDEINGDYRLTSTSPCIDSGNPFYVVGDFIVDLDGKARSWDASVDMGCYEFGSLYDTDGDLLTDAQEEVHETNPQKRDTDGDGLIDTLEFWRGTDPLVFDEPTGLLVPEDYPFVSQAVYLAYPTEEIIVQPGTYTENILISKDVVLTGSDPLDPQVVAATVLDGSRTRSVITFLGNESPACRVTGLTLTRGSHARGGGINGNGTQATIAENRIVDNVAYQLEPTRGYGGQGGGIHGVNGTISGNFISENHAHYGCGVAYCNGDIVENRIEGNETLPFHFYVNFPAGIGGGLYRCGGSILGNEIVDNIAGGHGGGLAHCSGMILDNRIFGNRAGPSRFYVIGEEITLSGGGGLFDCDGDIVSNEIRINLAANGGGLGDCDGFIYGNRIEENTSEGRCRSGYTGAVGIYCDTALGGGLQNCDGVIERNRIIKNFVAAECGGTSFGPKCGESFGAGLEGCDGTIANNVISDNRLKKKCVTQHFFPNVSWTDCIEGEGGALSACNGSIYNNTLIGNESLDAGGGISNCSGTIQNCIFWLNSATEDAQIHNSSLPDHSLIQDWSGGGIENIDLDPMFVDLANGDFHLRHDSPCIDSGVFIASVTDDYEGNPRPFKWSTQYGGDGSGYDMGAYEFRPTSDVDYDGKVGALDLIVFQYDWGAVSGLGEKIYTPSGMATDMDGNGVVDTRDLLWFLEGIK